MKASLKEAFLRLQKFFAANPRGLELLQELKNLAEGKEEIIESTVSFPLPENFSRQEEDFFLFSDGACRGNPGPGAYALMAQNSKGDILFETSGVDLQTTNNRMELMGAIESLRLLREYLHSSGREEKSVKAYLFSDSKYVVEGSRSWLPQWKARQWKKSDQKTPENLQLWQEWDQVMSSWEGELELHWVKGHSGHPQNERCDQLANLALDELRL